MTSRTITAGLFRVAVIVVAVVWSVTAVVFGAPVTIRGRGTEDIEAIHGHPGFAVLHFIVVGIGVPLILAIAVAPFARHLRRGGALFATVFATLSCAVVCAVSVSVGVWLAINDTAAPTAELVASGTLNTLNGICAALIATVIIPLAHSPTAPESMTPPTRLLIGGTGYACALSAVAHLATAALISVSAWMATPLVLVTALILGVEQYGAAEELADGALLGAHDNGRPAVHIPGTSSGPPGRTGGRGTNRG